MGELPMSDIEFNKRYDAGEDSLDIVCEMAIRSDCNYQKTNDDKVLVSDRYNPTDYAYVSTKKDFIAWTRSLS